MSSNTELVRGYHFELAGSIQFPLPNELYEDLGFDSCPIYEPEIQSASVGPSGEPPILLYSDPERLLVHLGDEIGLEAVMGMAEVAGWAEAPARALGRFEVRKPPKSLDDMWACASNEKEWQAIRTAMFGSVMDVVDQFLPDRVKHAQVRSMLSFLAVNSTYLGPYTPGSALCLAFALASPGDATMSKVRGGIGAMSDHLLGLVRAQRGRTSPSRQGLEDRHVARTGSRCRAWRRRIVTAPVIVSNLDPTATFTKLLDRDDLPDNFAAARRSDRPSRRLLSDSLRAQRSSRVHGPIRGPERGKLPQERHVLRNRRADAVGLRGLCQGSRTGVAFFQSSGSYHRRTRSGTAGQACRKQLRVLFPDRENHAEQARLRDEMAKRMVDKIALVAPNFPDLIERQFNYPAYTYELMFGCTGGDFTHGLLQPEFMGPFRPGPRGWPDNPVPIEGLYLCGAGCHGGPGVTFIPGYNCGYAVLDAADGARS